MGSILVLEDLYKRYGEGDWIFENVNLEVEPGEFVFLLGSSGSGKTTFMRIVSGQENFNSGRIFVNGIDLRRLYKDGIYQWRRQIGIVFQDFRLLMDLSVQENIALPLILTGFKSSEVKVRVKAVLKLIEMEHKKDVKCRLLSGGEKQLVAIGRAIIHSPILILADEPTGNLDDVHAKRVLRLFSAFHKRGQTLIVATHDKRLPLWVDDVRTVMIKNRRFVNVVPLYRGKAEA